MTIIIPPDDVESYRVDILNLIFFSANFVEACQSILKLLIGQNKKFNKMPRRFKDLTSSYRSHVSKIINEIKHKHKRIRPFFSSWNDNLIVGYYVEGVVQDGVLGPGPLIHNEFHGMKTGFSLNRNIYYHLINIYSVSRSLRNILVECFKLESMKCERLLSNETEKCLSMLSDLPVLFFPNEIEMKVPAIKRKKGDVFSLDFPSERKVLNKKPHVMDIHLSQRIGLKDKSFALPYFIYWLYILKFYVCFTSYGQRRCRNSTCMLWYT